ncbi:dihydrodipicolinate reductase C-terminal domain-containing protein [Fundidesulfovibrio putealis]|uniref:dihydrodipicolinate reductase C-terminal domain-containing protein n=1 Tax=Fundidesulfovibrio putealis TaxID=270496 RepID=UPI0004142106|nr:dihydrodipicolinate reductase C-terminal domain-containing protein [Fundidesulfovibrio putealis]
MTIIIAGSGKLATELLNVLPGMVSGEVLAWADAAKAETPCVVVHAGSGRELESIVSYCGRTGSPLIELATGSSIADHKTDFPVVVCPNTNILMLKFMAMLAASGHQFKDYTVRVTESHQADKTSVPGTAVNMAASLGLPGDRIRSIRDPHVQQESLKIPQEYLSRHAYHRIEIEDPVTSLSFETKVFGNAPYAEGVAKIISAVRSNALENTRYSVMDFIEKGWL